MQSFINIVENSEGHMPITLFLSVFAEQILISDQVLFAHRQGLHTHV